ncbi:MAG: hypothetical protein QOD07_592 [Frankiaceae bacterium]|jgi:hypothetical protein|nr:hypothetical protein [Frankiaceae bacterium]
MNDFDGVLTTDMEFLGPFTSYEVLFHGRSVPHLKAQPMNGGMIALTLDDRFDLHLSIEDAERVVPFLADCIAVAAGYSCHPRRGEEPRRLELFPPATEISTLGG